MTKRENDPLRGAFRLTLIWVILGAVASVYIVFGMTARLAKDVPTTVQAFQVDARLNVSGLDRTLGEVFSIATIDQNFHCAATFLKAVNSRQSTNSNELEFYCRDLRVHSPPDFKRVIPKLRPERSKTDIALYKGKLVDLAQQSFLGADGRMAPLSDLEGFKFGSVRFFSRLPDGRYIRFIDGFMIGGEICRATSLVDDHGIYYGSINVSSYATTFGDKVVVNEGGQVKIGAKLEPMVECAILRLDSVIDPPNGAGHWVYGGLEYGGDLVMGGSNESAPLYRIRSNGTVSALEQVPPFGPNVSEYYSYMAYEGRLLIGTFPAGDPVVVDGINPVHLDRSIFPVTEIDHRNKKTSLRRYDRYRELQSMAFTSGYLMGGMYPWGEVLLNDTLTDRHWRTRVFSHPTRTGARTPYREEALQQVRDFEMGKFDDLLDLREVRRERSRANGEVEIPRTYGLFEDAWGQRVSQIVVLSGEVCVSTGSMGDSNYIPRIHGHLDAGKFSEYGRILCADLNRHVLAEVKQAGTINIAVKIDPTTIQISTGGSVESRGEMNNQELLDSLRGGYTIRKGNGVAVRTHS